MSTAHLKTEDIVVIVAMKMTESSGIHNSIQWREFYCFCTYSHVDWCRDRRNLSVKCEILYTRNGPQAYRTCSLDTLCTTSRCPELIKAFLSETTYSCHYSNSSNMHTWLVRVRVNIFGLLEFPSEIKTVLSEIVTFFDDDWIRYRWDISHSYISKGPENLSVIR